MTTIEKGMELELREYRLAWFEPLPPAPPHRVELWRDGRRLSVGDRQTKDEALNEAANAAGEEFD